MMNKIIGLFEDDPKLLRLYGDFLRGKGFRVFEARDAFVGLALVGKVAPDLVLLDINMPQMSGFEACGKLREILGERVPILFLTANDDVELVRRALEAGGNDLLPKSTSMEALFEHIETWLADGTHVGRAAPSAQTSSRARARVG